MEQRITGKEAVKIVGELDLSGNLIPRNWYRKIKLANGKPNLNAITILSEIVYWYRPVKDGKSCPKFAEDLWQCSYAHFEEAFGFSRKQILTAFAALKELGWYIGSLRRFM